LHLCYDLACMIHTKASLHDGNEYSNATEDGKSTTIVAVRFWTEQLKRAMVTRYGTVGNNVNVVRQLLHHTKQVVRNKDGIDHVINKFI
jgi:hypothetical protein